MRKLILLLLTLLFFTGCNIEPIQFKYRGPRTLPKVPLAKPELACPVYVDAQSEGTAFPVEENFAITAAHVVKNADRIVIMNYPAFIAYLDEERDVCVLQTDWRFEKFYDVASYYESLDQIGESYERGDSGTPLFSKTGTVVAILTGQKSDGEFVTSDIRFLQRMYEEEQMRLEDEAFENSPDGTSSDSSKEEVTTHEKESMPYLPHVDHYNPN